MKRILATTAMSLLFTTAVFAADNTGTKMNSEATGTVSGFQTYDMSADAKDLFASDFIGKRIYSAEQDYDSFDDYSYVAAGAEQNWEDLGEINDIVLNRDGEVEAVILGVGGFLGIGEKDVAVDMDSIKFVNEKDNVDDYFLVVNTTREMLENAPAFERATDEASALLNSAEEGMSTVSKNVSESVSGLDPTLPTTAAESANNHTMSTMQDTMYDGERVMLKSPEIAREGYSVASTDELTADDLTGARIMDEKDEDIGEIDELIVTSDGKLDKAILDIGGFLGVGEHQIAVTMDELEILRDDQTGAVRVYIDATQEELEAQPEYNS